MLIAMLNHPRFLAGEFDLSSLKQVFTGATAIPVVLMEQVKEHMGADCRIYFGLTEVTGGVTMTCDEDSFALKSATVGKPYPHLEVKIVNPATGEPVGLGERGEFLARSFNIVGRVKEMIIRGGENLYPAEIEQLLMRHPKLADAQVIGVPDAFMGEEMAALIRLKPDEQLTEEELRAYCRANISHNKVPKYFKFVVAFPLTASGKVKKFELREQLIQELGLQEVARTRTA
jgi:fatty-acyl-CoA synthase